MSDDSFLDELEREVADERQRNMPRKNTPKAERRKEHRPSPALTDEGVANLTHPPRPRKQRRR